MNTLFDLVFTHKCRSTHHKIALDALRFLDGPEAETRRNLLLARHERYFDGAKAPDTTFKDFTNHVLHVRDDYWGGAPRAARKWYATTVDLLRQERWDDAVYAAGVMSHYFADPHQPFHTGQTEEEGAIHRSVEWSIAKSYSELQNILEDDFGGYPHVEVPVAADWLEEMIRDGAEAANIHYKTLIDHYDAEAGRKNPPAGLDQETKDRLAGLIGLVVVGLARVLDRAFEEAACAPPKQAVMLRAAVEALDVPSHWVAGKIEDVAEARVVNRIRREVLRTGKALKSLPADDKVVRAKHAEEVLRVPLAELDATPARATGTKHGTGEEARLRRRRRPRTRAPVRIEIPEAETVSPPAAASASSERVSRDSSVERAPSIGPKTAARLAKVGIVTIGDLLSADPDVASGRLATRWITVDVFRDWQAQARLVLEVDRLFGHDAQILVALGVRDADTLAREDARALLDRVKPFAESSEGQRIIRSGKTPDLEEVSNWIDWARKKERAG